MKKLLTICLTFMIWGLSSSQLNDNLNLINEDDSMLIKERIKNIEESEVGIKIYVNTLVTGEGFQISNPLKSIILNIEEDENEGVTTQLSFSKDFNIEDQKDIINLAMDNSSAYLKEREIGKYVLEIISNIEILFESIIPPPPEEFVEEDNTRMNITYWLLFSIILMLVLILRVLFKRKILTVQKHIFAPFKKFVEILKK